MATDTCSRTPQAAGAASATGSVPAFVQTRLGPIECIVAGEGPALLALHGGMGGHDQSWLLAHALLPDCAGHRIVAPSRPGYLGTALAVARTPEEQADAYAGLLDALGIADAVVAAVSAGGPSALQFALRHPGRCRGLILISACTGRLEPPSEILSRLRLMQRVAHVPGLAALMRWRTARNPQAPARRAIADPLVCQRTLAHPIASPLLRFLQASVFDQLGRRLPGTINDTELFTTLAPVPAERIAAPTLIVHGTADRIVPFCHAEAIAKRAPHSELFAVAGGEHVALFTHLDEIRQRVARFLAGIGPRA